jgi:signal transduction histidine kinase
MTSAALIGLRGRLGTRTADCDDNQLGGSGIDQPGVMPRLLAVAMSTPALLLLAYVMDVSHRAAIALVGVWSLAQIPLLVHLLHHQVRVWSQVRTREVEVRVASAEAAVRKDEERLHELRTTVAGIGITHRLLRDRKGELPRTTCSRLESLYESELARLERMLADQGSVTIARVDIEATIAPLVDALRLRGRRVTHRGSPAVAVGRADDIVEIMHVLLENAARHAPASGIEVDVLTEGHKVWIQVSDHGPGVPEPVRSHLFERGARAPESTGQGIGLHIARRLAQAMQGELRFDARYQEPGATFTLVLPAVGESDACLATSP